RPPGSSFKPFVYAAALNSGVDGSQPVITPATILMDEPTTFTYEGGTYDPGNYKQEYHGAVTVREALNQSLNVATVRLAEMVGYDRIRKLAIEAGMNKNLLAVVWVGYDDDRDLRLTGGASARPVWTEFMKRATQIPAYQKVEDFTPPPGVVTVELPASPGVPGEAPRQEVFIEGTEPRSP